jgi:CBS domain-containing protein
MQTNLHGLMTDEAVTRLAFDDPNELPRVGRRRLPQILRDRRRGTEGRRNGEDGESAGGELHSALANVTLALVILHVFGVGLYDRRPQTAGQVKESAMKASEIMARDVVAVVRDVAKLMVDQRISGVPVIDHGKLVGSSARTT